MSLADDLAPQLPYLRRFARALTGSQSEGDMIVRATLEAIIAAPQDFPAEFSPRVSLYGLFLSIWSTATGQVSEPDTPATNPETIAHHRLGAVTPRTRQALLLTAMEGFTDTEAAQIIGCEPDQVRQIVQQALEEIDRQTVTEVLIIEDEPIISIDLEQIVRDLGHRVTRIAVTRSEAVQAAVDNPPGLVLADIQLADGSSGIDAVRDILEQFTVPVIFITAFPERLLTGDRPEPTYLITKPFQRATVRAAIAQALFLNAQSLPERRAVG
ncbi:MAG: response regulator [Rhodothalassiaceae bacterium]